MKKLLTTITISLLLIVFISSCQKTKTTTHSIAFYNVENLFDTVNSPGVNDERYTPEAKIPWNAKRYGHKLDQLSRVIKAMDTVNGFPVVIGLSEIENAGVLKDLVAHESLKEAAYSFLHQDSPDARGIDVAMLYQPKYYKPLETNFIYVNLPDSGHATRDILYSKGILAGADTVHLFFNHWVSRWGGQEVTEPSRIFIAQMLKHITDSIMDVNADAAIIMAGDLNDNPTDTSVFHVLAARKPELPIKGKGLYNLSLAKFENGEGSLYYRSWDMFDQFIVSPALLDSTKKIHLIGKDQEIVKYDWMLYKPRKGDPRPSRTAAGKPRKGDPRPSRTAAGKYYGGFSDHLPVLINLEVVE